ncbi:MAG: SPASM domain-containing protein, partial [Pseudoflavonifractor sp.]
RFFENLVGMLLGHPPESCGMLGSCTMQYVVEADGSVFPCDFYVLDEYKLGNLNTDTPTQLDAQREKLGFITRSRDVFEACTACPWFSLCRGGCKRNRIPLEGGAYGGNVFCAAYRKFFSYAAPRLQELARISRQRS